MRSMFSCNFCDLFSTEFITIAKESDRFVSSIDFIRPIFDHHLGMINVHFEEVAGMKRVRTAV